MKNPFPGMNPWLESRWHSVHTRLIVYLCDQIQEQLPPGLRASIEEGISVDLDDAMPEYRPDFHVAEAWDAPAAPWKKDAAQGGTALLVKPMRVKIQPPPPQRHIEILETGSGERVVTVIEILSPTNKQGGKGLTAYMLKTEQLIIGGVNLVEIDLIRGVSYSPIMGWRQLPERFRPRCAIAVSRQPDLSEVEFYPLKLRERLPVFAVPLRRGDQDVALDLQAAINLCCENSGLSARHYQLPPMPPAGCGRRGMGARVSEKDGRMKWADDNYLIAASISSTAARRPMLRARETR